MKFSEKIKKNALKEDGWLQEALYREANKDWLDVSQKIALKILRFLRKENMTQKELAKQLGFSPQYLNKVLKGKENLTIETIMKIQNTIKVDLIQVPEFSTQQKYEMQNSIKTNLLLDVDKTDLFFNKTVSVTDEVSVAGNTSYAMAA